MNLTPGRLNAIRCALYFAVSFIAPISSVFDTRATASEWPSLISVVSAAMGGLVAGLVAVRAYLDGSNERYQQARDGKP
jgi:hypothetical protein